MQATLSASTLGARPQVARASTAKAVSRVAAPARMVVKASAQQKFAAVQTAAMTAAMTIATSPAMALVDDRMNGDGTGRILGVNEPVLGWVILGTFTTVWGLYSIAAKGLGGGSGDDSGLSL
mmetsp:Transcript_31291/g.99829  ORF Transcript_31291/g.99829 Transcript_31291/m.99829 type:complete len:122 (-) Transcript_31291:268-633(-)